MRLAVALLAALACGGCSWSVCRTNTLDLHLINPAAPSTPPGTKCTGS